MQVEGQPGNNGRGQEFTGRIDYDGNSNWLKEFLDDITATGENGAEVVQKAIPLVVNTVWANISDQERQMIDDAQRRRMNQKQRAEIMNIG